MKNNERCGGGERQRKKGRYSKKRMCRKKVKGREAKEEYGDEERLKKEKIIIGREFIGG